jgi:uncharacterized membrane protein
MTGGAARVAIKPNSKKARIANASEKQLKVQKAQLRQMKKGSTASDFAELANTNPRIAAWSFIIVVGLIFVVFAVSYPILWLCVVLVAVVVAIVKIQGRAKSKKLDEHLAMKAAANHARMASVGSGPNIQDAPTRPAVVQDTNQSNAAERLRKLNELYEAGLLTDDEFATKRASVIDGL